MNGEPDHIPIAAAPRRDDNSTPELLLQMSHDIRSAMSDVLGGIRLVDSPRLDPQTKTQIDRVRAAADTLAALVDDVLLLAAGETLVKETDSDLVVADWLAALTKRWTGPATEQSCQFTIHSAGELPARLTVSSLDLDRIIGNLVANALTHVPGGDVLVEVSAEADGALSITVCDSGGGFPQSILDGASGAERFLTDAGQWTWPQHCPPLE